MSEPVPALPVGGAPRGGLRLLIDPVFGTFFVGKLVSTAGIWIHNTVAAILAYELSGSAVVVGMVSVAQFAPQLLLAPLSGAMADRGDRRRQLLFGTLLVAAGSGGLAAALWLLGTEGMPGAWPVVAAGLVVGLGFVLTVPAGNALIPALVRTGELAPAVALGSVPPTLTRAVGPAIGALIAVTAGPAAAFAIAATGSMAFVLILLLLDVPTRERIPGAREDGRVRAGLRHLARDRGTLLLLIGVAAVGIGTDPTITLAPVLAASLGEGPRLVGALSSAFGIGSAGAFLVILSLQRRIGVARLGAAGLLVLATGTILAGVSPSARLAIIAIGVAGTGMTLALVSLTTQMQQRVPDRLRGRIMALWSVALLGSRPFAAALNGAVAEAAGPTTAFLVVGTLVVGGFLCCRPAMVAARPAPLA